MQEPILLSTAYFPPLEYFSLIARNRKVRIEKWENFLKQTYRNRCTILGTNGPLTLTVPVLRGSFHKTALKDLEIDNTRRWRDHHLRSIISACATAPFFEYYFDVIEGVVRKPFRFLLDQLHSMITDISLPQKGLHYWKITLKRHIFRFSGPNSGLSPG